jgi:solute carrier family 25 protein 34/35
LLQVKTHLQSRAVKDIAVGYQHTHQSMTQGLLSIFRSAGITGMWRGAIASVIKVTVGSAVQLTTFSFVKQYVVRMKVNSDSENDHKFNNNSTITFRD